MRAPAVRSLLATRHCDIGDDRHRRLLRACRQRPGRRRAAKKGDELASSHCCPQGQTRLASTNLPHRDPRRGCDLHYAPNCRHRLALASSLRGSYGSGTAVLTASADRLLCPPLQASCRTAANRRWGPIPEIKRVRLVRRRVRGRGSRRCRRG
jgi:hypothetical protein